MKVGIYFLRRSLIRLRDNMSLVRRIERSWRKLERLSHMAKGTIRRLISDRGYGFIKTEEGEDLFFHRNDLEGVDYESLTEGQEVEFEVTRTAKGLNAAKVKLAGESS